MKQFEESGRINWVDEFNNLVRFEYVGNCCEDFGFRLGSFPRASDKDGIDLEPYEFDATTKPVVITTGSGEEEDSTVSFLLVLKEKEWPRRWLWLTLYSYHKGFCTHRWGAEFAGAQEFGGRL